MSDPTHTHGPAPDPDGGATRTSAGEHATLGEPAAPGIGPPGYEILGELGRGGIGVVYKARQARLNRTVALKMLRGADLSGAAERIRFLAEAEAVAAVRHPHVVQVFEVGDHDGLPFLALEYLPGGTLAQRLKVGPGVSARLQPRAAAELVARLAAAVQAVHDQGIVHRDLKPSNVLFDESGSPKVADFGLAKRGTSDLTKTQAVMGTPAYMSPEQAKGETKFVGPTADVWALGVILYECLTGTRPFEADESWAVLRNVIHSDPAPPRKVVPGLPRDLELICLKCLGKEPHRRYPTAAALADDLNRFLAGQPVSVRPAGPGERLLKWARRNPTVAGLLAALVVAFVFGFGGVTWALLKAEARGRDLARANDDLKQVNDDLTKSRDALAALTRDLTVSRNDLGSAEAVARTRAEEAEYRGYLSDINLAHQFWRANDVRTMREVLARCPPHRRKWEWHHLDRLTRPLIEVIPTDSMPIAVAYSPDGSLLAYQTVDGALTVRDLKAGRDRFRVPATRVPSRLVTPAFRPDGRELAYVAVADVRVVDTETGRFFDLGGVRVNEFDTSNGLSLSWTNLAVGYTPEGRLRVLRYSSRGQPAKVYFRVTEYGGTEAPDVTVLGYEEPEGVSLNTGAAAFSPDASRFAVLVIDTGMRYSRSAAKAVEPHPKGATPPKKGDEPKPKDPKDEKPPERKSAPPISPQVLVHDAASGKPVGRLSVEGSNARLSDLALAPDGGTVAFGRLGQAIEAEPGRETVVMYSGHTGQVLGVAFDRRGRLWSGGESGLIRGHDRALGDDLGALRGCPFPVLRLAASADGREVAAAAGQLTGSGGAICRFDVSTVGQDVWRAPRGPKRFSLIAGVAQDGRFAVFDAQLEPGTLIQDAVRFVVRDPIHGTERVVKSGATGLRVGFRPAGGWVTEEKGGLRVYDPDGTVVKTIPTPEELRDFELPGLVCSPDGRTVTLIGLAHLSRPNPKEEKPQGPPRFALPVAAFDLQTGKPGWTTTTDLLALVPDVAGEAIAIPTGVATDPGGRVVAAALIVVLEKPGGGVPRVSGLVLAWEAATGKEVFRRVSDDVMNAVAFDPAGRLVAGGGTSAGGRVVGWDLATGAEVMQLRAHTRPVLAVAFDRDGRMATGGTDGAVKLWDPQTGWEILTVDTFPREVGHLVFTPDGDLVAGTGFDLLTAVQLLGPPIDWVPAEVRVYRGGK
jgi:WD40 repeat protein/tRNA A-37 threonylcarbamoyl transferase component Bud32